MLWIITEVRENEGREACRVDKGRDNAYMELSSEV